MLVGWVGSDQEPLASPCTPAFYHQQRSSSPPFCPSHAALLLCHPYLGVESVVLRRHHTFRSAPPVWFGGGKAAELMRKSEQAGLLRAISFVNGAALWPGLLCVPHRAVPRTAPVDARQDVVTVVMWVRKRERGLTTHKASSRVEKARRRMMILLYHIYVVVVSSMKPCSACSIFAPSLHFLMYLPVFYPTTTTITTLSFFSLLTPFLFLHIGPWTHTRRQSKLSNLLPHAYLLLHCTSLSFAPQAWATPAAAPMFPWQYGRTRWPTWPGRRSRVLCT